MKTKYTPYGVTKLIVCLLLLYLRIILHQKLKLFFSLFASKIFTQGTQRKENKKKEGGNEKYFLP